MNSLTIRIAEVLLILLFAALVIGIWQIAVSIRTPGGARHPSSRDDHEVGPDLQTCAVLFSLGVAVSFLWLGFSAMSACGWDNYAVGPLSTRFWYPPCMVFAAVTIAIIGSDLALSARAAVRRRARPPRIAGWLLGTAIMSFGLGAIPAGLFAYLGSSVATALPLSTSTGLTLLMAAAIGIALAVGTAFKLVGRATKPVSMILAGTVAIIVAIVAPIPVLIEGKSLRQDMRTFEELVVVSVGQREIAHTDNSYTTDTARARILGLRASSQSVREEQGKTLAVATAVVADAGATVCVSALSPSGRRIVTQQTTESNGRISGVIVSPPDSADFDCSVESGQMWRTPGFRMMKHARQEAGAKAISHC